MKARPVIWCLLLAASHGSMYLLPSLWRANFEGATADMPDVDAATKYHERSKSRESAGAAQERTAKEREASQDRRESRERILKDWLKGHPQMEVDDFVRQKVLLAGGDIELLLRDEVDPFRQALASHWAKCEIDPLTPEEGARRLAELPADLVPEIVLSLLESGFEGAATMGIPDLSRTIAALDEQGLWEGVEPEAALQGVGDAAMMISPWEDWEVVVDALSDIPREDLRWKAFEVAGFKIAPGADQLGSMVAAIPAASRDAYLKGLIRWHGRDVALRTEASRLLSEEARREIPGENAGDTSPD